MKKADIYKLSRHLLKCSKYEFNYNYFGEVINERFELVEPNHLHNYLYLFVQLSLNGINYKDKIIDLSGADITFNEKYFKRLDFVILWANNIIELLPNLIELFDKILIQFQDYMYQRSGQNIIFSSEYKPKYQEQKLTLSNENLIIEYF